MIVRRFGEVEGSATDIRTPNWRSLRAVLAADGTGFSVHETTVRAGTDNEFWYAHHVEAVVVVEGEGELEDRETGTVHPLGPGSVYVLDGHERHVLRPFTDIRAICFFTPALRGDEVHDRDGAYPPA